MLVIGNKKYRNLQEQVGWNTEQIYKIFEFLDGINVSDNVVVVPDLSYILNQDELDIINRQVAFIVYDGKLYIKKGADSSLAYFDVVFSITGSTTITFNSSEIQVTLSNGALGIINSTVSTYSVSQIDGLLSAKASTSYVDTNFAKLSGANFTGAITAPSITENMSGYSASINAETSIWSFTPVYTSVVKTGNKVTFVANFKVTMPSGQSKQRAIIDFTIPSAIGSLLIPTQIGLYSYLDQQVVPAFSDANTYVNCVMRLSKNYNNSLTLILRGLDFVDDVEYLIRYEATFLLSDNMLS